VLENFVGILMAVLVLFCLCVCCYYTTCCACCCEKKSGTIAVVQQQSPKKVEQLDSMESQIKSQIDDDTAPVTKKQQTVIDVSQEQEFLIDGHKT
jgi:hypothetical protein